MTFSPVDVLIIGCGMYVCGRGTNGDGTVLPAVFQAHSEGLVGRVLVAGSQAKSISFLQDKVASLNRLLGIEVLIEGFPKERDDSHAYMQGLAQLGPRGCVIVVVPDHLHYQVAKAVIQSRHPVLIVKPFTPTVEEGQHLVDLAREARIYGAIEFHKRWDVANRKLQGLVAEKRLGVPLYALVEFSQRKDIPLQIFRSWAERTNVFQYLGVHYVDLLAHLFQAVPQRAMAIGQFSYLQEQGLHTPDAIEAMVEWRIPGSHTPFLSTFLVNWIDPNTTSAMSYQSLKVIGTAGRYESDQKNRGVQIITDREGVEDINPYFTQSFPVGNGTRYQFKGYGVESIRTFLQDVRQLIDGEVTLDELEHTRPTLRQGMISTAVCEAVTQSLQAEGSWIPVTCSREWFA